LEMRHPTQGRDTTILGTMKREDEILSPFEKRANGISDWLKENGREQKHLDRETQERIYWHYGYLVALRDIYRYLADQPMPNQTRRQRDKDALFSPL
jgi:hypothetical protein